MAAITYPAPVAVDVPTNRDHATEAMRLAVHAASCDGPVHGNAFWNQNTDLIESVGEFLDLLRTGSDDMFTVEISWRHKTQSGKTSYPTVVISGTMPEIVEDAA